MKKENENSKRRIGRSEDIEILSLTTESLVKPEDKKPPKYLIYGISNGSPPWHVIVISALQVRKKMKQMFHINIVVALFC